MQIVQALTKESMLWIRHLRQPTNLWFVRHSKTTPQPTCQRAPDSMRAAPPSAMEPHDPCGNHGLSLITSSNDRAPGCRNTSYDSPTTTCTPCFVVSLENCKVKCGIIQRDTPTKENFWRENKNRQMTKAHDQSLTNSKRDNKGRALNHGRKSVIEHLHVERELRSL